MAKQTKVPHQCYYCTIKEAEERCIYCTDCRLAMARGEITPNYIRGKMCLSCGEDMGGKSMSNVICDKCINEI
jgi:hypothetical protein